MALVARDGTLDGITADERLQLNDIDEVVGLAAQLIRNCIALLDRPERSRRPVERRVCLLRS